MQLNGILSSVQFENPESSKCTSTCYGIYIEQKTHAVKMPVNGAKWGNTAYSS